MAMNLSGKRTRTRRNSGESCSITITATKGESRLIGNGKACEPVWCNFQVQGQRIPKRGSSVFFYVKMFCLSVQNELAEHSLY